MSGSAFRLLTFNCLWQGAARERLAAVAPVLDESNVDFLCLQEVTQRRNVGLLQRDLRSYQPPEFRPYGVAVKGGLVNFARRPIERSSYEVFRGRGPHWTLGWADRLLRKGFLTSWLRFDALPVVVVNTHMLANYDEDWSPGNRFARQQQNDLAQLAQAVSWLGTDALVIVAGDFNVPMTSPMLGEFMAACDLHHSFSSATGPAQPTIRNSRPHVPPQAIDHILFRAPSGQPVQATARLLFEEAIVLASGRRAFASDHLAVEAAFTF
ncbi:MAG TPA: endonuclease/exonuclease/phosphatase family protein [Candidatus Dormibacteraeota bacterium]